MEIKELNKKRRGQTMHISIGIYISLYLLFRICSPWFGGSCGTCGRGLGACVVIYGNIYVYRRTLILIRFNGPGSTIPIRFNSPGTLLHIRFNGPSSLIHYCIPIRFNGPDSTIPLDIIVQALWFLLDSMDLAPSPTITIRFNGPGSTIHLDLTIQALLFVLDSMALAPLPTITIRY